jgi:pyruvate, orthophosphate dikinase
MFGNVVMGVNHDSFEEAIEDIKEKKNAKFDTDLSAEDLTELVDAYKKIIEKDKGSSFPTGSIRTTKNVH